MKYQTNRIHGLSLRGAKQRGVTLVEVMIVVAIMAMLAGGITFALLPQYKKAQIDTARTDAAAIRKAIQEWQRINNDYSCPTISQLVKEKVIDSASNTEDPWNGEYKFTCTEDDVTVASAGPDKKTGSADDIKVPKGASEE